METASASDLLQLANLEYRKGNYADSEAICARMRESDPTNADVLLLLSSIHFKCKNFDESTECSKLAVESNPMLAEGYNNLANVNLERGDLQKAIANYKHAIRLKPKFVDGHVNLGNALVLAGQNEEAILAYLTALQCNGNLYTVRSTVGDILRYMGRLEDAKTCYLKAIDSKQDYAIAWNNLGVVFTMEDEIWLAIHHFEKATQYDKSYFDAFKNLGDAMKLMKIYDKSIVAYLNALNISPDNPIVLGSLACAYNEQGLLDLTIETYKRAISVQPIFPDAYCNLANVYKEKGFLAEAEKYYNVALEMCPAHSDTLNNLANVMREKGMISDAARLYKKALDAYPEFAAAHSNYASILQQQGKFADAIMHYKEAIRINPTFSDAYSNMGNTLKEMQDMVGAINCYSTAIQINPLFADAHSNLGSVYKDCGNVTAAIKSYQTALKLRPNFPDAFCNLAHCYQIVCDWSDYENRMKTLLKIVGRQLEKHHCTSLHPHHSMLYPLTQDMRRTVAARHANMCEGRNTFLDKRSYGFLPEWHERLRIGYVSSDFCNHPTSHLMQSIPGLHDRSKFEIFCYALNPSDDTSFYATISTESEHFVDCSSTLCHGEVADKIYEDKIHVLVNMNGYTKGARNEIFALHPAPIQIMWLGYPGTSGSKFIDYIVTDRIVSPFERADEYTEKLAYMPDSFFIGDHKRMFPHLLERIVLTEPKESEDGIDDNIVIINAIDESQLKNLIVSKCKKIGDVEMSMKVVELQDFQPILSMLHDKESQTTVDDIMFQNGVMLSQIDIKVSNGETVPKGIIVTARQHYCLPDHSIVFCNFNQLYKLNPSTFSMWMDVLKSVPNSVLWLLRFPSEGEANIKLAAKDMDVEPSRIIFSNVSSKEEHVRRGQLADVCLDTPMCNGHTTSMDILWAGTPIVTYPGESFASRVAASQLNSLGCPELVAESKEEYVKIAIKLGTDKDHLLAAKSKVRDARTATNLFDTKQYTTNLENIYNKMWNTYCEEGTPNHIV